MTKEDVQILEQAKENFKEAKNSWIRIDVKQDGVSPYPHSTLKKIVESIKNDDIINLHINSRRHCIILQVSSDSGKEKMHYIYLNDRTLVETFCYFKVI